MMTTSSPVARANHHWLVASLLALGLALLSPAAAAGEHEQPPPRVTTSATGEVRAVPDIAVLSGDVIAVHKSAEQALAEARQGLDKVIRFARDRGVEPRKLQASHISVQPIWHYPKNAPRVLDGYQAMAGFSIELADLGKLPAFYTGLAELGVNQLQPLGFEFSNRNELELQAIEKAVLMARAKAVAALQPLDSAPGEVQELSVHTEWQGPVPFKVSRMAIEAADAAAPAPPQVNVGEQGLTAQVTATFAITRP